MNIAVVILNWNGLRHLQHYLPRVLSTTPDADIVVADNGSTDGSVAWLKSEMAAVKLILLDKNYGFAEGYNRALKQLEGYDAYVLLNSDIEPTEGWLQPLVEQLEQSDDVAVVVPKILDDKCREKFEYAGAAGGFIDILGYPFCRGRILSTVERDEGQYDTARDVMWGSGAAFCCRADVYAELGGLCKEFFAHQEEIDLCWRLNSRGYKVMAVPQSVVFHVGGGTLEYESPRKTFLNFRNNLLMLYKNLPTAKWLWVMLIRMPLDYVAALQMLLNGKWLNFKAVCQARCAFWRLRTKYKNIKKDNLRKSKIAYPATICRRSIIFDYYLFGKRK